MLRVDYIDNFETKASEVICNLATTAGRVDIAVAFLSYPGWTVLRQCLTALTERGGRLRVIVRRDRRQTSPEAVGEIFRLPHAEIAFGLSDTSFHPKDYLFFGDDGKTMSVLTSSANATYPGLTHNDEGGAVVTHGDAANDPAAQKMIAIFERRWSNAKLVDEAVLKEFSDEAVDVTADEGALVRSRSEQYKRYGIGRVQKARNGYAKVEFNPSVFKEPPYLSENKTLALGDLETVDSPLDRAARNQWDEAWRFELKMMAARFLTGNKGGQLSNARTEILPHQIFAAHRVVSNAKRRFLLADEVGLGKTIEAGMIWQALSQRGQARRTLIITPAGLTTQWQEEMQDKFGQLFEVFGRDFLAFNPAIWDLKYAAIASLDTLKRPEHKRILLENRKWDLIIFDEAHRLSATSYGGKKTDKTQNYQLAEEIRDKHYSDAMLLLTATPHQGDENHSRFKHLLLLLDEDINFRGLEREGLFDGGTNFKELVIRTPKKDVTDAQGKKVFKGRITHRVPFKMYDDEARFYKAVAGYIRDGYNMLDRVTDPFKRRAAGFLLTTFQKLNASSTAAIKSALTKRHARLSDNAATLKSAPESTEYDERFEGEEEERVSAEDGQLILQNEIDTIKRLVDIQVQRDKKMDELLGLVDHIAHESPRRQEEKVLIFTEYRETQRYIVSELERQHGKGSVVVIHGDMELDRKEDRRRETAEIWAPFAKDGAMDAPTTTRTSQRLFREHERVRFLVSTEAGGEGINLQFCHICINYDLPWNPMRVEQRVGRVYRYGQDKVVQVYNFFNRGTIEELVQTYFEDRLVRAAKAISQVTGEDPEDIKGTLNGQIESEIDPESIYKRTMVEGNLNKQTQKEIDEAVARARLAYELATHSLFRDVSSYSFDGYRRELAADVTLSDLERFAERFLAGHRRQMQRDDDLVGFIVPDVLRDAGLPERYRAATFNRDRAVRRGDIEFLALGHPFVDAMLAHVGTYDFGGLTASRLISSKEQAGKDGFLFVFVLRTGIEGGTGGEYLFEFAPVFITSGGLVDPEACRAAVQYSEPGKNGLSAAVPDTTAALAAAKKHIEKTADIWDWEENVEFIGLSYVVFQ